MMALHAICCGLPALALMTAALAGAASGALLFTDSIGKIHDFVHAQEAWILAASAALVLTGGFLEAAYRRTRHAGFPWMFAFSVACFLANVGLVAAHRLG